MTTDASQAEAVAVPAAGTKATDIAKPASNTLFVKAKRPVTIEDVRYNLQLAVELEHATLPVYLQAAYSLDDAKNGVIANMIIGVAMQEMEHFCQAANILVAVGGHPAIDDPKFVPSYPGGLPKEIGTQPGQAEFIVHLRPFSKDQIKSCFMVIEEPADPVDIKDTGLLKAASDIQDNYRTIGEFYEDIAKALTNLGDGVFSGKPDGQVYGMFGIKPILCLADAQAAIERIIVEGEGTPTEPTEDGTDDMAHYYTYYEIYKGRKIAKQGDDWVFTDETIPFDPTGVADIPDDPKQEDYAPGSAAAIQSQSFNTYYSNLLKALHLSFNGNPDKINDAIALMFDLKIQAKNLMQTPLDDGSGKFAAPTWQYVP
ncbi:ferritin-like domain-containing protein [Azospirillum endophyticum]